MNLNIETWKEFKLGDLFTEMYKAEAHIKAEYDFHDTPGDNTIKFISRTEDNNGCDCYIINDGLSGIEKGNAIVIGDTTATISYQVEPFVCGDHIVICRAEWINLYTALFVISILKQEKYKYSYGRAFKMQLISDTLIKLPLTSENLPDWDFIEQYIKSLKYKSITTSNKRVQLNDFNVESWKEFRLTSIFTRIESGKAHDTMLDEGDDCIYLGAKKDDNCIMRHCASSPVLMHEGNCIVFICNGQGSVGYTNYIDRSFIATTDLKIGYCDKLNKYNALFLVAVLDKERQKYSFGRKWGPHLRDTILKLPAKEADVGKYTPDWVYMENYMKSLPYGDRI